MRIDAKGGIRFPFAAMKFVALFLAVLSAIWAGTATAAYEVPAGDRAFLSEVMTAVEAKDARWLAAHAALPMIVGTGSDQRVVRSNAEFASIMAGLLTAERWAAMKAAAHRPLFKNWRGMMLGDGVLWFDSFAGADNEVPKYLILALGGFAFQSEGDRIHPTGPAYVVHGRLSTSCGTPGCRIWVIGSKRILGVAESGQENSFMPVKLQALLSTENLIFGDFTVVPLADDEPGVMRPVCVTAAKNLVITDGRLRFLRRVTEEIVGADFMRSGIPK